MAANQKYPLAIHCFQPDRFEGQDDWRLWDLSVGFSGNIAVSGHNWKDGRTFIDLYSGSDFNSVQKPKVLYSGEFDKYFDNYRRCVSLLETVGNKLVTSVGDKIEVIDFKRKRVVRSHKVKGNIRCLAVDNRGQVVTALDSNKVHIYDKNLSDMKSITMEEIPGIDQPNDMRVAADKLYVCTQTEGKAMSLRLKNGNILTYFSTTSSVEPTACSVAVSSELRLLVVLWNRNQIAFYSLSENKRILISNLDSDVCRIRLSDAGLLVTGNERTGELKIHQLDQQFLHMIRQLEGSP